MAKEFVDKTRTGIPGDPWVEQGRQSQRLGRSEST